MQVRSVRWSDFDDLVETYYALYDERDRGEEIGIGLLAERPSPADEVGWMARSYRRMLDGDLIWSAAEVDGRAVGSCTIDRLGATASSETAHVGTLGILVRRGHRGHGIGSALLAHALDAARAKFGIVRLDVFSTNTRAKQLYERFGFVLSGHVPRLIKRGNRYFDADQMVLELDRPGDVSARRDL